MLLPFHPESRYDERGLWKRFRQRLNLPEKNHWAILHMLDCLSKNTIND